MWVLVVGGAIHRSEVGASALDRIGITNLVSCLVVIVNGVDWASFDYGRAVGTTRGKDTCSSKACYKKEFRKIAFLHTKIIG